MKLQESKSWQEAQLHQLKVRFHQARRLLRWTVSPSEFRVSPLQAAPDFSYPLYGRCLPIRREDSDSHPLLEEGKLANLRLAAPCFDGLHLGPGRPLSFWGVLGRVTAKRGFRHGMELRAGCVVPALGGGLCLLSNALFEMAARLDWKILERHGHTIEAVPSHSRPWGLDATVFWPYVDLQVEPQTPCQLRVWVKDESLWLAVEGERAVETRVELEERACSDLGDLRCNELWRRVLAESGELLREEKIGENRKRVLHTGAQRRRNCMTCEEHGCRARVTL